MALGGHQLSGACTTLQGSLSAPGQRCPSAVTTLTHNECLQENGVQGWPSQPLAACLTPCLCLPAPACPLR